MGSWKPNMSSHLNDWRGKLHDYLLCCCWRSLSNKKGVVISCFHSRRVWLCLWWGQPATTSVLIPDLAMTLAFRFLFLFCIFIQFILPSVYQDFKTKSCTLPLSWHRRHVTVCSLWLSSHQSLQYIVSYAECFFSLPPRAFSGLVDALYAMKGTEVLFDKIISSQMSPRMWG